MRGVRHHLLDVASPMQVFTAHDYLTRARKAIVDILKRGKLPIVAGGTGFYIDALLGHVTLPNVPVNRKLRAKLEKKTTKQLFALLKRKDPRRTRTIDSSNKRRLVRALEIVSALGKVPAMPNNDLRSRYDVLWIGCTLQSKVLAKRIRVRLFARMKLGMVAEAVRLHRNGLSYKRMEQLGLEYRALALHLQGKLTEPQLVEQLDRDIRYYAKRQLTYWKRNKQIHWFRPTQRSAIEILVRKYCKQR